MHVCCQKLAVYIVRQAGWLVLAGCVGLPVPYLQDVTRRTASLDSSYIRPLMLLCKQHKLQLYSFNVSFLGITSIQLHQHFNKSHNTC